MKSNFLLLVFLFFLLFASCSKYLAEKSSSQLVIPQSLSDLQALMDFTSSTDASDPSALAISSDEYYLSDNDFSALSSDYDKRKYEWDSSNLFEPATGDWYNCYKLVYIANTVISDIGNIKEEPGNSADWENVAGQAYFYRGKSFYNIASIWCKSFDSSTMKTDLGIPLRLNPDFNTPSVRSTLGETYKQLLTDLKQSAVYLPVTPIHPMRPSKGASYGMLARIYLFMRDYPDALKYADSALAINNNLIDMNTLDSSKAYPIPQFNTETIYYSSISIPAILNISRAKIDTAIYNLFESGDLRKELFFRRNADGTFGFRGNYTASLSLFGGIPVDEMLLIHSEATLRLGNISDALADLNRLLKSRWKSSVPYSSITSTDSKTILSKILLERRKELLMRGLWWQDVKRLNKEGYNISLHRLHMGQTIILQPDAKQFVLPIPEDIIQLTGMQQND